MILGALGYGTLGTSLFFVVLGNYAVNLEQTGQLALLDTLNEVGAATAVVEVVASLPLAYVVLPLFALICVIFAATSYDSASYTLASSTTRALPRDAHPARWNRVFWAGVLGLLPDLEVAGAVQFCGDAVPPAGSTAHRRWLAHDIALVLQDARAALDPLARLEDQLRRAAGGSTADLVQALLLLGIYALLPLVVVLSRYSLSMMVIGAMAIFTVKFWSVLWYLAMWVDQNLIQSMYPDVNVFLKIFANPGEHDTKRMLLNMITTSLYLGLPLLWSGMMAWAGMPVGRSIESAASPLRGPAREAGTQGGSIGKTVVTKGLKR